MELHHKSQMDRSAQSFHHDLTFSQLCSMWSYRSIDPDFVPLPGPRRSGYICGCSGQQLCFTAGLCNAPFMPIAFLFFFLPPLPSSTSFPLPFFSTWDSIRQKLWHFIVKKGFRASRISQNFMGLQKETKSELTSRVFSAWHSAFWLRLSPFYSSMQCISWLAALSS